MTAKLLNASQKIDDLARIAEQAGSQDNWYDPRTDVLICEDVTQAVLDAAVAGLKPRTPSADDVRAEASRRIYARFPLHTQLNMQAKATELLLIGTQNWKEKEATEAAALQAARDWIGSVRQAAGGILALQRIPEDFSADANWPL